MKEHILTEEDICKIYEDTRAIIEAGDFDGYISSLDSIMDKINKHNYAYRYLYLKYDALRDLARDKFKKKESKNDEVV